MATKVDREDGFAWLMGLISRPGAGYPSKLMGDGDLDRAGWEIGGRLRANTLLRL